MKRITILLKDDGKVNGMCVDDATREAFPLTSITLPAELSDINVAAIEQSSQADKVVAKVNAESAAALATLKTENTAEITALKADAKVSLDEAAVKITELKSEIAELKKIHEVAINNLKSSNAEEVSKKDTEWKEKLDAAKDKNSELSKEIVELKKTIEDGRAILLTHQTETDRGMAIAGPLVEKLVATGDPNALSLAEVFSQFALYSSAREEVKKKKELKELRAQKKALEEKISALNLAVGDAK